MSLYKQMLKEIEKLNKMAKEKGEKTKYYHFGIIPSDIEKALYDIGLNKSVVIVKCKGEGIAMKLNDKIFSWMLDREISGAIMRSI